MSQTTAYSSSLTIQGVSNPCPEYEQTPILELKICRFDGKCFYKGEHNSCSYAYADEKTRERIAPAPLSLLEDL